ncbi:hypothetical protein EVAR_46705_1 [Eumeta japonica]|uniref:Uncharacterized protein n=1 Tax=Eumeta variegata TaxID=151549 RepID=A0A4C1XE13_EUMVA|nr:hypothetical protein EVAR_46705_1 [Eumeta japonica]
MILSGDVCMSPEGPRESDIRTVFIHSKTTSETNGLTCSPTWGTCVIRLKWLNSSVVRIEPETALEAINSNNAVTRRRADHQRNGLGAIALSDRTARFCSGVVKFLNRGHAPRAPYRALRN